MHWQSAVSPPVKNLSDACCAVWASACKQIKAFQAAGQPTISIDTKKKELVGDFKNGGRELRPKGDP